METDKITRLLLHLRYDTYCSEGIISWARHLPISNVYINQSGIESTQKIIQKESPQIILIEDEKKFMDLAEVVSKESPKSLNLISESANVNCGIKLRSVNGSYQRLMDLGFIVYSSGWDNPTLKQRFQQYNDGTFEKAVKDEGLSGLDLFEALKNTLREEFKFMRSVL